LGEILVFYEYLEQDAVNGFLSRSSKRFPADARLEPVPRNHKFALESHSTSFLLRLDLPATPTKSVKCNVAQGSPECGAVEQTQLVCTEVTAQAETDRGLQKPALKSIRGGTRKLLEKILAIGPHNLQILQPSTREPLTGFC
jgi:hypothetical protein